MVKKKGKMVKKTIIAGSLIALFMIPVCANPANSYELTVPSNGDTVCTPLLPVGVEYEILAEGTYVGWLYNGQKLADAEWRELEDGTWIENPPQKDLHDILIDEVEYDWWGTTNGVDFAPHVYSENNHTYLIPSFVGEGQPVCFRIQDSYYADNSGALYVSIYETGPIYGTQLSADENCKPKDVFSTNPSNIESIYVSGTLPVVAGNYDAYLVADRTQWNDGDDICSLNDGLVAYYPFNGNANDESGNGNDGTNNGAILTTDRFGNSNSAYKFEGGNAYIEVLDDNSLDITGDFTICLWIRHLSDGKFFSKHQKGVDNDGSWMIAISSYPPEEISFNSWHGSGRFARSNYHDITGSWAFYCITYLKATQSYKVYIDGSLDTANTVNLDILNTAKNLWIGKEQGSPPQETFGGDLDDIRMYNRALSPAEIQELYAYPNTSCIAHTLVDIPDNGTFCDYLWTPPGGDENFYDIVLDVNGNGLYDNATDYIDMIQLYGAATLIELSAFTADPKSGKVVIEWSTESETDNAGFNLYRADAEDGPYEKINDALIPAEGAATAGADYRFSDEDVRNRRTYYYKLEDVDISGVSTMHGPVKATPRLIHAIGR